jgi:hypothetical protein
MHRWRVTTATWFKKSSALLQRMSQGVANDEARWLVGYETEQMLTAILSEAEVLVPLLVEEDLVVPVEVEARKLAEALRRHRVAMKLEQTQGRTPEEAEAFRRKAADLRTR